MSTKIRKIAKIANFTQLDNIIIRDKNINNQELGYFMRLWFLPPNFEIRRGGLQTLFNIKKNQYYKLNKSLQNKGYISIFQENKTDGKFGNNIWELDDTGCLNKSISSVFQNTVHDNTVYCDMDTNNTITNNTVSNNTTTTIVNPEEAWLYFEAFGFVIKEFQDEFQKFKLLNKEERRTLTNWKRWCVQIKKFNK